MRAQLERAQAGYRREKAGLEGKRTGERREVWDAQAPGLVPPLQPMTPAVMSFEATVLESAVGTDTQSNGR